MMEQDYRRRLTMPEVLESLWLEESEFVKDSYLQEIFTFKQLFTVA